MSVCGELSFFRIRNNIGLRVVHDVLTYKSGSVLLNFLDRPLDRKNQKGKEDPCYIQNSSFSF